MGKEKSTPHTLGQRTLITLYFFSKHTNVKRDGFMLFHKSITAQLTGAVEYNDCISAEG